MLGFPDIASRAGSVVDDCRDHALAEGLIAGAVSSELRCGLAA